MKYSVYQEHLAAKILAFPVPSLLLERSSEMQILHGLEEAAKMLGGISIWTLRRHIGQGKVNVVRLGRRVFLDSEELERIRRNGLPSLRTKL